MRWFLRGGFGESAHYGTADIVMHAPAADLVLPVWRPRAVEVLLRLAAPDRLIEVSANGRPVGAVLADADGSARLVILPAETLRRGDNVITLRAADGAVGTRLLELRYRMAGP
jgi:hypothetical protein